MKATPSQGPPPTPLQRAGVLPGEQACPSHQEANAHTVTLSSFPLPPTSLPAAAHAHPWTVPFK